MLVNFHSVNEHTQESNLQQHFAGKDGLCLRGGSGKKRSGGQDGKPSEFPDGLEMREESQVAMRLWPLQLETSCPQLWEGRLQMGQSSVGKPLVKLCLPLRQLPCWFSCLQVFLFPSSTTSLPLSWG